MTVLPPQSKLRMLCSGHAFTTAFKNAAISALDIRDTTEELDKFFNSYSPDNPNNLDSLIDKLSKQTNITIINIGQKLNKNSAIMHAAFEQAQGNFVVVVADNPQPGNK